MWDSFHYNTLEELKQAAASVGEDLPLSENISLLNQPLQIWQHTLPNRLAIQPMEGCDGEVDGSPGELTFRRYRRFAESGGALIWEEATAIVPEGRANPRQLMLTEKNLDSFRRLTDEIREYSQRKNGFAPLLILQATHSGRYSKPQGTPAPLIAYHNPIFEQKVPIDDARIVSDDYLKRLPEQYAKTAVLAAKAGFDGVDIKACHRYLMSELLSAYTRPGLYGGDFENRTRLFRESLEAVKAAVPFSFGITSRLNLYDGFPYPNGFGIPPQGGLAPALTEPIRLIEMLQKQMGIEVLDCTIGNPYFNPHVNRPFDKGPYSPPEHPLTGVARMCHCIMTVKKAFPDLKIISSGYSYLRQFGANLAAGMLEQGGADMAGVGRQAFAYPDFAEDILQKGAMNPKKCCLTCSKCTELMRAGSKAGCVLRDKDVYLPLYQRDVLKK